jgi:hypothetical protein
LLQANKNPLDLSQLPQDGVSLAFMAAAVLQISPQQKQELLSVDRAENLIDQLLALYRRELALMGAVLADNNSLQAGGFSIN